MAIQNQAAAGNVSQKSKGAYLPTAAATTVGSVYPNTEGAEDLGIPLPFCHGFEDPNTGRQTDYKPKLEVLLQEKATHREADTWKENTGDQVNTRRENQNKNRTALSKGRDRKAKYREEADILMEVMKWREATFNWVGPNGIIKLLRKQKRKPLNCDKMSKKAKKELLCSDITT